jgi:8-oxo-dGTP pyrophosphatase MutT (NUDIX family)
LYKVTEELVNNLKAYRAGTLLPDEQERGRAAVLIPIINKPEPTIILTQRAARMDSHAGEVAWPGGKQDPEDDNLAETALRECHEEIGLAPDKIEVVAELRPFISKYGLLVTPFVGLVQHPVQLKANPDELDSIFQVPLSWLKGDPRTQTDIVSRFGETHRVPVYHFDGFRIWGLTAMILWEFMVEAMGMDSSGPACDKLSGSINDGWE